MNELVEAVGVPKSTILYYVNEGLLPPPVKTTSNMAYYYPESIERVQFIKSMQINHGFPLAKIKKLLEWRDGGEDITKRLELMSTIFRSVNRSSLDEAGFCESTGLTSGQVRDLLGAKLILPLRPGSYDQEDIEMGIIYARGLSQGICTEDLSFYPRLAKQVVDEEMSLRRRMTQHLPYEADAEHTIRMVQAARATRSYVIDRLFQLRVIAAGDLKDEGLLR